MGIIARGVSQIKTLAAVRGSGTHSNERHVRQFQIASLELERTRRSRERKAAADRIATIDARLSEIEALMLKHREALDGPARDEGRPAPEPRRRALRYG